MKEHYLYRHIRLDKNEPFYIGIGTVHSKHFLPRSRYERAFSKLKRNPIWKNIVNLNLDYEVEILLESNNYDFIKNKEIEFIKLYGRINNKTGCLSNITDGGEGLLGTTHNKGRIFTEETRKKLSLAHKGKTNFYRKLQMISVNQFDLEGNFIKKHESILSTKIYGFDTKSVSKCCKNLTKSHKGYIFKYV